MKKLIIAALASLPALAFAQDGKYSVQGSVGAFNAPAKMYLESFAAGKTVVDSATLINGKFQFEGTTGAVPKNAYLIFNQKGTGPNTRDYKMIYLEKGTVTVTSSDTLKSAKVAGTKTNEDNTRYEAALKPTADAYAALEAKQSKASPEEQKSEAFLKQGHKEEKAIDLQEAAINKKFIQENPDSFISLNVLESYAYSADYVDIAPLFNNLSPAIKETDNGKKFAERLPKLKAVALGAVAPEFAEADTAGKIVNLSSFRGKYVLIDFWASWCGPCRHENPNVVKAYNRYKDQKFTIVGVSLDRPNAKDKWLKAIHTDGLAWTQLSDLQFWNSKTAGLYAVRAIPQNFLLDPNGKIIGKNLRGDDLEDKLAELFPKAAKAGKAESK
ncbi:redoxin domain-containing protein [Mucilaginibacter sp.]|uniref:redoxin domain-containing protein n=1 Tax=Mucilaginibacter sp. TaxID=1882438 RepID=UPI003D124F37